MPQHSEADSLSRTGEMPEEHAKLPLRQIMWLAGLLVFLLAATVLLYFIVESSEMRHLERITREDAADLAQRMEQRIAEHARQLSRLVDGWRGGRADWGEGLAAEARRCQAEYPAFIGVAGVDSEGQIDWSSGGADQPLADAAQWQPAMADALRSGTVNVVPAASEPAGRVFMVLPVVAVATVAPPEPGRPAALVAYLSVPDALQSVISAHFRRSYDVQLLDGEIRLMQAGETAQGRMPQFRHPLSVGRRQWTVQLQASPASMDHRVAVMARWILWGGIPLAFLATGALWLGFEYRLRERVRQTRRHLAALESLNEISTAISGKLGSGRQILDQLAASARVLLRMTRSGIALIDERTGVVRVVALAGDNPKDTPTELPLSDLPAARQCIQNREILFEEDIRTSQRHANRRIFEHFNARSTIVIPLQVQSRCIGLMALSSSEPRRFTDADRRLARLMGSQASVILANNRLYEQVRSALEVHKQLLEQQDRLYAASAAVYHASTFEQSARAIAELAPGLLGMDMCIVSLIQDSADEMRVAAATGRFADLVAGKRIPVPRTNAERALSARQLLVIEDAPSDPTIHPMFRLSAQIGSIIYAPLYRSDGKPLGMLSLIRHQVTRFSDAQRKLCQVFADRAAAALENAELHEQTRRDATTRAVLLRELHHRVKNNLAGIVGLLSMNEPDLPPAARAWLDRVIARIRTMAQAYDLFSGGVDRIDLQQLINQVMPSLSVLKPQGVTIRTQVPAGQMKLATPQAVSLAMVLHELCTNALTHGLAGGGTLTIASHVHDSRVVIDVADDGNGMWLEPPPQPPLDEEDLDDGVRPGAGGPGWGARATALPAIERGTGLQLVRELVGRELRGTFELKARPGGGTTATVELPVEPPAGEGDLA